jgi:ankyrin repeat protein
MESKMNVRYSPDPFLNEKFFSLPVLEEVKEEEDGNQFSLPESEILMSAYLESQKFEDFRKEVRNCLEKLIEWVDEAWKGADEHALKESLVDAVNNFFDTHFLEKKNIGKSHYALYVEGIPTLSKIIKLLKGDVRTLEAKKNIVCHFIEGLAVCSGGSHTHIMDAHEQLSTETSFQLMTIRKEIARKVALEIINGDPELVQIPGNEIHYVNAVLNYFSESLGISKVNDFYCDGLEHNPVLGTIIDQFRDSAWGTLTLNNVLNILIRDLDISNLILENGSMLSQEKLMNKLNSYGCDKSFRMADLFSQNEDKYILKKEEELEFYIKLTLLNRLSGEGYISLDDPEDQHRIITIHDIKVSFFCNNIRKLSHVQYKEEGELKKESLISFLAKPGKENWYTELYYFCMEEHRDDLIELARPFPSILQNLSHAAVQNGDVDCIKKLSEIGIALNTQNTQGDTIAHIAAYFGYAGFMRVLEGINKNLLCERNAKGRTPLHIAAAKGQLEIVQILILSDAPLNARDNEGNTPLHLASYFGHEEIVSDLVKAGSNLNGKNLKGQTSVHLAVYKKNPQDNLVAMIRRLRELGAHLDEPDKHGRTPQDIAKLRGHLEVTRELECEDNQRKRKNSSSPSRLLYAPCVQNNSGSEEKEEAQAKAIHSAARIRHRR